MAYSQRHRERVLQKLLTSGNSQRQIASETGVGISTIQKWLRERRKTQGALSLSSTSKRPQDWTAEERLQALVETAPLSPEEKSAWCRSRGVHVQHLDNWKRDFLVGASQKSKTKRSVKNSKVQKKVRTLEKELHRKEKALAEASALLLLKKKVDAIWGDQKDD
jgi:transposase-like protein